MKMVIGGNELVTVGSNSKKDRPDSQQHHTWRKTSWTWRRAILKRALGFLTNLAVITAITPGSYGPIVSCQALAPVLQRKEPFYLSETVCRPGRVTEIFDDVSISVLLQNNLYRNYDSSIKWNEVMFDRMFCNETRKGRRISLKRMGSCALQGKTLEDVREIALPQQQFTGIKGVKAQISQRVHFSRISTSKSRKTNKNGGGGGNSSRPSRSSTMPGFSVVSNRQRLHEKDVCRRERMAGKKLETTQMKKKLRQEYGEKLYAHTSSVPDSMIQFGKEIHQENRITRSEEVELGEKTQAAVNLQNIFDQLEDQLGREPTDDEWCAASGKINMEALRFTIEDGLEAKNKLVTSNLRMVQAVVNTYIRNGLSGKYNAGDMMQEGVLALIRAAEKFEPDRGWKFSTYAMYWVRAAVKRAQLHQSRPVRAPTRVYDNHKRLKRAESEFMAASGGKPPTLEQLGAAADMSAGQIDRCISSMRQQFLSLDEDVRYSKKPNNVHKQESLSDILDCKVEDADLNSADMLHLREEMLESLERILTPLQAEVLKLRFGLDERRQKLNGKPHSVKEVGVLLNLTPDQVRRHVKKSIKQIQSVGLEEWSAFDRDLKLATNESPRVIY